MAEVTTEGPGTDASPMSGTARGLLAFLDFVIEKHYMRDATASALKTGVKKVLEVEDDLDSIDMRHVDLDEIILRFRNRNRGKLSDKSLSVYEQRIRQSVDMYLRWLNHESEWLPARTRSATAVSVNSPTCTSRASIRASLAASAARNETSSARSSSRDNPSGPTIQRSKHVHTVGVRTPTSQACRPT